MDAAIGAVIEKFEQPFPQVAGAAVPDAGRTALRALIHVLEVKS